LIVTTKPATPTQLVSLGGSTGSVTDVVRDQQPAVVAAINAHVQDATSRRFMAIPR
jgi:hypothetical protein